MTKTVAHIFGGEAKVKIMRLFVFNPGQVYSNSEIARRTKERIDKVRREVRSLEKAELLKKKGKGYVLNPLYAYRSAIETFLIDAAPITDKEIVRKLTRSGNLKLVLISGLFLHDKDSRVDILVVGDHIKQGLLLSAISRIEAEIGKEIRYAVFETPDFTYRLGIYDKLIRDILDNSHRKILNKLGI